MTGSTETPTIPLSEKLAAVTHLHLITRVPIKLDLDNWNFGSWEFFFEQLCYSYDVQKFIHGIPTDSSSSSTPSFTQDDIKADKIVLSWIFTTLSESLQRRLVVARPKTAKEAWDLLNAIVKDNKRSRTNALKVELRSIRIADRTMETYLGKLESIATILASLDSPIPDEDLVHYALEGLNEKYDQVCGIMHHKDHFPDFKTARSMLITEEMRLKSKSLSLPVDASSSSPLVLMTNKGISRNPSNPQFKSKNPCINFAKGACRFGNSCKFVHDTNTKSTTRTIEPRENNSTEEIVIKILGKLGITGTNPTVGRTYNPPVGPSVHLTQLNPQPLNYYNPQPSPPYTIQTPPGFAPLATHPTAQPHHLSPPGFAPLATHHQAQTNQVVPTAPPPHPVTVHQPSHAPTGSPLQHMGHTTTPGQETILPHAFQAGTLHDPTTGGWNMDTGFNDASSASPM